MDYRKIARMFADDVKRSFGGSVRKVILFGSVARGDYRPDSDIDILVVVNGDPWEAQKRLLDIVLEYLLKYGVYISAKAINIEEYEFMKRIESAFYTNVKREGISLG
jgi:predicted nucleotidyltransferase